MSIKAFLIIIALIWVTTLLFKKTFYPSKVDIHDFIKKTLLARKEFANKTIASLNFIAGVNYTQDEYTRIRNLVLEGNFEELAQENYDLETDCVFVYKLVFKPNESYIVVILNKSSNNNKPEIKDVLRLV